VPGPIALKHHLNRSLESLFDDAAIIDATDNKLIKKQKGKITTCN
tara:strand:- start:223 stop:357 length:135 start_codon:yes stop_codon:yes gene_type:complete